MRRPAGLVGRASLATYLLLASSCERAPTAAAPVVLTMSAEAGSELQTAVVRSAVPIAPSVRVLDNDGQPVAGRRVVFFATVGDGTVLPNAPIVTGADGVASLTSWALGPVAGPQALTAVIADATTDERLVFGATAMPGAPASLDVGATTRPQTVGDAFSIAATLRDADGNAVTTGDVTTFVSSVPAIASVSVAGVVNALSPGSTVITVSRAGFDVDIAVIVSAPPSTFIDTRAAIGGAPHGVAISSANVAYVTHTLSQPLSRFDLPAESPSGTVAGTDAALDLAFLPDGSRAYVSGDGVIVIDADTHTAIDTIAVPDFVWRIKASTDGQYVYATSGDGSISRITTATGSVTSISTNGEPLNGLALHPTRNVLLATSVYGSLHEVDLATFTLIRTITIAEGTPQALVVSADGSRVFVAREGAPMDVRDGTTLTRLATAATVSSAFDVAITPNGLYLIVSDYSSVKVIDAGSFVVHQSFDAGSPRRIAINASGTLIMIATPSPTVIFLK